MPQYPGPVARGCRKWYGQGQLRSCMNCSLLARFSSVIPVSGYLKISASFSSRAGPRRFLPITLPSLSTSTV